MRLLILLFFAILCSLKLIGQQVYVTDSITYRYIGEATPERAQSYLRQFGLKNHVTDKTEITRNGDFIEVRTDLSPKPLARLIEIILQSKTDPHLDTLQNGIRVAEDIANGISRSGILYTESGYFSKSNTVESPYVTIWWILYDKDEDNIYEELEFKLVTSLDIAQIYHCHLKE